MRKNESNLTDYVLCSARAMTSSIIVIQTHCEEVLYIPYSEFSVVDIVVAMCVCIDGSLSRCDCWAKHNRVTPESCPKKANKHVADSLWAPIRYKDDILPEWEIPLGR